jgi:DNA-binding MarR family transcriptional regulator
LSTTKKMEPSLPRSKARRKANAQIAEGLQFPHNGQPGEGKPAAVDLDVLNGHLGYFARRAQLSIFQDFIRTLSIVDIRPAQYAVLVVIGANPGLPQMTLGNTLGIERGRLVRVLDELEGRGLTRRAPSTLDRRSHSLHLTPAGQLLLARAKALAARHEARCIEKIGPANHKLLIDVLKELS